VSLASFDVIARKLGPPKPPPEKKPRPTRAELMAAATEFRRTQPLKTLTLPSRQDLTLRAAYELIVSHSGTVDAGSDGSLVFKLPERLVETGSDFGLRDRLQRACQVLDECRGLVHARLQNGEELPDARPALGGGVVE
jgi:hypothetical protein